MDLEGQQLKPVGRKFHPTFKQNICDPEHWSNSKLEPHNANCAGTAESGISLCNLLDIFITEVKPRQV